MAGSLTDTILQRKSRYRIRDGQNIAVVLERVSDSDRPLLTAGLIDLSQGGVKMRAASCVPIGEVLQLKVATDQLEFEFQTTVEVCWTRPTEGEDWLVGCAFRPQIPNDIFDRLVAGGLLERREAERRYESLPVAIRWELGEEADSARLQDYSDGGFCIATNHAVEIGQRLFMSCVVPDGKQSVIPAKVQWMLTTPEHYLVGCTMLNSEDFGCLRALEF